MNAPALRFQYGPMRVPGEAGVPGVPSRDMVSKPSLFLKLTGPDARKSSGSGETATIAPKRRRPQEPQRVKGRQ